MSADRNAAPADTRFDEVADMPKFLRRSATRTIRRCAKLLKQTFGKTVFGEFGSFVATITISAFARMKESAI
ncbi:MAG: hypothetical protein WBQ17_03825 [Rhizomicrobium sp.]